MKTRISRSRILPILILTTLSAIASIPPIAIAIQDKPVLTDEQKKKVNAVNDQVRAGEQLIELAETIRRSADSKVSLINDRSSFPEADETSLRKLEELADAIRSVANLSLLDSLNTGKTQLEKAKTDLTAARDALPAEATGLPEEVGVARKRANDQLTRLTTQSEAQTAARTKVQNALNGVPNKVRTLAELFPARISDIAEVAQDADATVLTSTLPPNFKSFIEVELQRRTLRARWKEVALALSQAGSENTEQNNNVLTAITAIDTRVVDGVLKKLDPWLNKLATKTLTQSTETRDVLPKVIQDPATNGGEAVRLVGLASGLHDDLGLVLDGWTTLNVQIQGVTIAGFDRIKAAQAAKALTDADLNLTSTIAIVQDGLTGDASEFVADKVSLYYFTEVDRIMKMLNSATFEMGGVKDAQQRAAQERQKLTSTELDLAAAMDQVNTAQRRVVELQEELRQSKAGLASAMTVLQRASRSLKGVQDDHAKNETRYNNAKTAADANPTDPEKQLALARATEERDKSAERLKGYEQRNEDATRERDAAKERNDLLTNEQSGLPARIQQAKDQLENAQSAVARQRRAAFLAAQTESEAFALARDNRPFLVAPAIAGTRDPVHRVLMYAFTDSKTIFLRGKQEDVDKVKDIIARFDSPAPQARLTLWTMEMSSDTSDKGNRNFNRALIAMEEELANNRALTTAAISFLRDCLNNRVNEVADTELKKFSSDVRNTLREDMYRVSRLYFYQPEVAQRLGFSVEDIHCNKDEAKKVADATLYIAPDPAGTTTLGETLMILSLAKRSEREIVMTNFRDNLKGHLQLLKLNQPQRTKADSETGGSWETDDCNRLFASTARALGLDRIDNLPRADGLTSMQLEIVHAAEKLGVQRVSERLKVLTSQIKQIDKELADGATTEDRKKQLKDRRKSLVPQALVFSDWLERRIGIKPDLDIRENGALRTEQSVNTVEVEKLSSFASAASDLNPLRTANPRVAAADQMLKDLIIAVEDDLERIFIQRMLNRLRLKITREKMGVGVGVMQRTSVLATNRLLARVDPRASAQLAVGEEQNILQSVQQLAQIFVSTQTGGPLGLLGALDAQPREAPPEIYGINSGNTFQVTPIFDPSGQALRFKFDFVGITRIQEPNGSVSRQLPRIERHTVNTEVQLSNLEIREISRFESNARIGRPTEYIGGLPIIKDIPKVRPYLPLLGWFIRRGGKGAVLQESLIFGQTTMYPTISDIMDLLTPQIPSE